MPVFRGFSPICLQNKGCSIRQMLTLLGALLICFCVDGCTYNIGIMISYWSTSLNVDTFFLSWVGSIQMLCTYGLGPLSSFLINYFGLTAVAITGAIVASLGHLITGIVGSMITLYICFGAMAGIGYGLLYMAAIIAVTTGFDELRPMAMGIMACGSGIGASVHSILYPFIESIVTWKGLSISTAGLLLHACIFGCLLGLTPPKISAQPQVTQSAQNPISSMFSLDFRSLGLLGSGYLNLPTNPTNEASTSQANLKNAIVTPNMQHMMGSLGSFTYLVEIEKIVNQMGLFGKGDPLHRNTAFLVFIIAVFLQSLGSLSPVVLFFDMLLMEGMNEKSASSTVALMGIFNAVARLLFGTLATFGWVNKTFLLALFMVASGGINVGVFFFQQVQFLQLYSCVVGLCLGTSLLAAIVLFKYSSAIFLAFLRQHTYINEQRGVTVLHPLVLADLVQLERLTEAMGWEIMLGGLGYCLSTPLATSINLWHGNIHISYLVSGILMVLGGCFAILTHWSHRTFTEDDVNRLRRRLEAALG
ncbi:unnamed protein product [Mesocestoides corti]|uniref:Major facilitator superfamily (MFS) profile domain-containing protein n=1 Tax=Mesocestoides corti TaxID=53468 RepID=A0A0R3U7R7_MESCO|nr:unnamed protein product [Mesocestoides corti]